MEHCKYLESQYLNERTADVYFITENNEWVPAHKSILAANSLLLENQFNESIGLRTIEVPDVSSSAFAEFLFSFYSKYPEKRFTVENGRSVLKLAKAFDMVFCTRAFEQFLMKNLTIETICFGLDLAKSYELADLELHCQKRINEKKGEVFNSKGFLHIDLNILQKILEFLTIIDRKDVEIVWAACMNWSKAQCIKSAIDSSDLKNHRQMLGDCFDTMCYIALQYSDFMDFAMKHYGGLFNATELSFKQTKDDTVMSENQHVENAHTEALVIERFRETMLSTQLCYTNDSITIELKATKKITLNGIAFSTIIGVPKGRIIIRIADDESNYIQQPINIKSEQEGARNFSPVENFTFEPNQIYIMNVELTKDVVFYRSRTVSNLYKGVDFEVSFNVRSRRDILSHFFFST